MGKPILRIKIFTIDPRSDKHIYGAEQEMEEFLAVPGRKLKYILQSIGGTPTFPVLCITFAYEDVGHKPSKPAWVHLRRFEHGKNQ